MVFPAFTKQIEKFLPSQIFFWLRSCMLGDSLPSATLTRSCKHVSIYEYPGLELPMALFSTFLLLNIDLSLLFNYRFPTL